MSGAFAVTWAPREPPLAPTAVLADGPAVARRLLARCARLEDEELAALSGVGSRELVLLFGPRERLPWVEGVSYLGRDETAPALLLPTLQAPALAAALLERAVLAAVGASPVAVLPDPPRLVPLSHALPLRRGELLALLAELGE